MVVAALNASWDITPSILRFIADGEKGLDRLDSEPADTAKTFLRTATDYANRRRPYDSIAYALEAWAILLRIDGPERTETIGRVFCAYVRQNFPDAPPGFERVGRMRQM